MKFTTEERDFMIEWLAMTGYSKGFYSKMKDEELELYYRDMLDEEKGGGRDASRN